MNLRKYMTDLAFSIRKPTLGWLPYDQPISYKSDQILFDGKLVKRKRIVLLTSGCRVKTCSMCPFPNEALEGVTNQHIIDQFENSFVNDTLDNYEMVTIFCNGNYLNNQEISVTTRDYIFNKIRNSNVQYIAIETLPQYVTYEKLSHINNLLGSKKLVVFMGLQSANDSIRNIAVNTTCTLTAFEKTVKLLHSFDYMPVTFLMVKPSFVTEKETIKDCLDSLQYLANLGAKSVTLCPMRVAPYTVAELLYQDGMYKPAQIWTVIEILKKAHSIPDVVTMVNTTELKPDKNEDSECMTSCPKCQNTLIASIEKYLYSRDLNDLNVSCDCYESYLKNLEKEQDGLNVEQRVELFLRGRNYAC